MALSKEPLRHENGSANGRTAWPAGPARIALASDRGHWVPASHARLERGWLVAGVDGEWIAWGAAEVVKVRWGADADAAA